MQKEGRQVLFAEKKIYGYGSQTLDDLSYSTEAWNIRSTVGRHAYYVL